jgi:hypothetical protein
MCSQLLTYYTEAGVSYDTPPLDQKATEVSKATYENIASHCATKAAAYVVGLLVDLGVLHFGNGQAAAPAMDVELPMSSNRKRSRSKLEATNLGSDGSQSSSSDRWLSSDSSQDDLFLHVSPFASPSSWSSSSSTTSPYSTPLSRTPTPDSPSLHKSSSGSWHGQNLKVVNEVMTVTRGRR